MRQGTEHRNLNSGLNFGAPPGAIDLDAEQASTKIELPLLRRSKSKLAQYIRNGAWAGLAYGLYGIGETYYVASQYGAEAYVVPDMVIIAVLVGIPSLLLATRKGFISALALCALAIMNMLGTGQAWLAGDPGYDVTSVLFNVVFVAAFARAAWATRLVKAHTQN